MEEMHRARYVGRGTELAHPLWAHHSPGTNTCSLARSSLNPLLLECMEASRVVMTND